LESGRAAACHCDSILRPRTHNHSNSNYYYPFTSFSKPTPTPYAIPPPPAAMSRFSMDASHKLPRVAHDLMTPTSNKAVVVQMAAAIKAGRHGTK
jgi:hypothetical protein